MGAVVLKVPRQCGKTETARQVAACPVTLRHFVDAPGRLDVLSRVYGSDASLAKLLDVDWSRLRLWREGQRQTRRPPAG